MVGLTLKASEPTACRRQAHDLEYRAWSWLMLLLVSLSLDWFGT